VAEVRVEPETLSIDTNGDTITLRGEIDISTAAVFERASSDIDGRHLAVDLSGVTFMDSFGLSCVIRLRNDHPQLKFVNANERVRRLFEVSGLTFLLTPDV
jgi:anti-anti-sigma factor